ncbi:hypothetical protein N7478_005357 [Penicillium angulare]|uniref:uncharacterized protein n=1 Tax=Penicillium angulare TaxID=116970 RepID=UPI0025400F72|nr:uncharacterized protein N7478_005357 [Penicillium angulare]KAJ5279985.1 hypothetical protein N7478_005357 [Penicillium angulare]
MLPIRKIGWTSLQALRSHLAGKLIRFKRNENAVGGNPTRQVQNDAAFFEADLRYIFTMIPTVADVPYNEHKEDSELNKILHDLLTALDGMVNRCVIDSFDAPRTEESKLQSHDTTLLNYYPQLYTMLTILEASAGQFNLTTGQGSPLFVLPEGQLGILP